MTTQQEERGGTSGGGGATQHRWYELSAEEALDQLDSRPEGLDEDEAGRRLREHGPNRIREQEEVSAWRIFLDQLTDPLIYVLIAALGVTVAIGNVADSIVIAAVLVINTTIGFIQEYQAESAVQSLMEMVSPKAQVRRSGSMREIEAEDLVPGDVVLLEQGEVVPADVRLLEVQGLQVNESPLTGESVPVNKQADAIEDAEEQLPPADQVSMAFMGTAVTSGEAEGVVTATGPATQIGQIAEQVQEAEDVETPLQARIDRLAKWIAGAILGVAAIAFGVGLLLGYEVTQMLLLAVSLAVAAIPAGLPVVVTVALAVGVRRMARRNAVIRNLPAVDTLGSCTVILSDKTGTLTQNRMTVQTITAAGERFDVADDDQGQGAIRRDDEQVDPAQVPALRETLLVGVLCNDAELPEEEGAGRGDPMEVALLVAGRRAGMLRDELHQRHPLRDKVPFRTEQKFMATIHDDAEADGGPLVLVKGAPERLVQMCDRRRTPAGEEEAIDGDAVIDQSEALAQEGLRVLAMAVGRGDDAAQQVHGEDPGGFVLVGMQGLLDPPRETAVEAVDRCHDAGIRVVMVTGDHATTAGAIGTQVHVGRPGQRHDSEEGSLATRRGPDLADLDDDELDEVLEDVDVFARVAPGQKLRLVERLQAHDEVVAVTGDGVNDAPALEAAHIGAAMGSGTDVAKEASDMVITDDNFASVYAAVEEGRTAFRNIRMATFFLLSTGAADILIILVALGLRWPLPLLPAQILWVNVVTNGIADVALAFEPGEKALFRQPPRASDEGVLHRLLIERLVIVGIWLAAGTLGVFWWQWGGDSGNVDMARTAAVTTLVLFQKVHVFNCRSEYQSLFSKSLLKNKVLFLGVLASLGLHVGSLYLPLTQNLLRFEPLDLMTWVVAAAVASTAIIVNELHKRLRSPEGYRTARADALATA